MELQHIASFDLLYHLHFAVQRNPDKKGHNDFNIRLCDLGCIHSLYKKKGFDF